MAVAVLSVLLVASCTAAPGRADSVTTPIALPSGTLAAVCGHQPPGPTTPPKGAVVVNPKVDSDLDKKTAGNPPGTTFWLAPGSHTLGTDQFGQVTPKHGDTYLGAPGAVLDGRGKNMYAFTQQAENVTIEYLTVEGFVPPTDQGVVNHDSGNGWVIAHDTIQNNSGAGLMAGAHQVVRGNCLKDNGQYGMNAFQAAGGITDLTVIGNEIVGNNTTDIEHRIPGCGCSGGVKFWKVNGALVQNNWVHDNHGVGLWMDTNNNDFVVEDNVVDNNDDEAIFYEISYNAIIRNNVLRGNAVVEGKAFASRDDNFPVGAIYISESGGEPRIPARTDQLEIYGNQLQNNWSGITLWENADRFCNSPNNSSGGCNRVVNDRTRCVQPGIASQPLYSDCRWKTQRVSIHGNRFMTDPVSMRCSRVYCGRMAILSNFGSSPGWSPYKGPVIQQAITFHQYNRWQDNSYAGPWSFTVENTGKVVDANTWQGAPYRQDKGSTFASKEGN
ncbi:MAG: right-handed parallel beta-helix repeat-containing protein [Sciscionella sp.]